MTGTKLNGWPVTGYCKHHLPLAADCYICGLEQWVSELQAERDRAVVERDGLQQQVNELRDNANAWERKADKLQQQVNTQNKEIERLRILYNRERDIAEQVMDLSAREQTRLEQQVNTLTEAFKSPVVYTALRHYYKQGLFDPAEYFDLDNAMEMAADLQSINESPREEQTE